MGRSGKYHGLNEETFQCALYNTGATQAVLSPQLLQSSKIPTYLPTQRYHDVSGDQVTSTLNAVQKAAERVVDQISRVYVHKSDMFFPHESPPTGFTEYR